MAPRRALCFGRKNEGEGSFLYRWEEEATGNRVPTGDGIETVSKSKILGIDRLREREERVRGREERKKKNAESLSRGPRWSAAEGGKVAGRKLGFGPVAGWAARRKDKGG